MCSRKNVFLLSLTVCFLSGEVLVIADGGITGEGYIYYALSKHREKTNQLL